VGSVAVASANSILDAYAKGTSYAGNAAFWVKLHIGAPGSTGTSNPAVETTRKQVTWGTSGSGAISNSAAVEWTLVSTTETYTHVSFWTASTAGTFLGHDDLSSSAAVTAGDTFRIPTGDLDLTITTAA
jgi:hypothetical protein